jgi:autotransporter-associated beta strand protein
MKISRPIRLCGWACSIQLFICLLGPTTSHAGSATWTVNPTTNDWNTAANWSPRTVPNGPTDTATFPNSNTANPVIHSSVELDALVFGDSTLTAYTIVAGEASGQDVASLTLSGTGIVNNSDASIQAVQAAPTLATNGITNVIAFRNSATLAAQEQAFSFLTALGGGSTGFVGGEIQFFDNSTAGDATLEADKGQNGGDPGQVSFFDNSSAAEGEIVNIAGNVGSAPGVTMFHDASTAGAAFVRNDPASAAGVEGGTTFFFGTSTAGDSIIEASGGSAANAGGGSVIFVDTSSAGNAILNGNSGSNGGINGSFQFLGDSTGGTAAILGNGDLMISDHNPPGVTIGSIEGGGNVFLGSNELAVATNLSKTYFGVIQGSGSLTKIGTGPLTLTGSNTYSGGTTVRRGRLVVNNADGSGTGSGAVRINAGVLAGRGTIAGAVTVGNGSGAGAALAPGKAGGKTDTLTIQNTLTFQLDSSYNFELKTTVGTADKVVANGVTINSGALFSFIGLGSGTLTPGTVFTAISNTAATPIAGTFINLADGAIVTVNGNNLQADYEGGDGNDLTLTVVP